MGFGQPLTSYQVHGNPSYPLKASIPPRNKGLIAGLIKGNLVVNNPLIQALLVVGVDFFWGGGRRVS